MADDQQMTQPPEWVATCDGEGRVLYWVAADGARRPPSDPPPYEEWHPDQQKARL